MEGYSVIMAPPQLSLYLCVGVDRISRSRDKIVIILFVEHGIPVARAREAIVEV